MAKFSNVIVGDKLYDSKEGVGTVTQAFSTTLKIDCGGTDVFCFIDGETSISNGVYFNKNEYDLALKSIKDKSLVWCWREGFCTKTYNFVDESDKRQLRFYDSINKCVFSIDGKRGDKSLNKFEVFASESPKWVKEAMKDLED
jgi:hypothetical protein